MKPVFLIFFLFNHFVSNGQKIKYDRSNIHAHNDYEKEKPFWIAYETGVGSIEADIFLENDRLIVAHDKKQVVLAKSLDSLYLQPLNKQILKNKGRVFRQKNKELQLMIDLKTGSPETLDKLVHDLQAYPAILQSKTLRIVISGSRPDPSRFTDYPEYILFDGVIGIKYTDTALRKINMLSDNFKNYSSWDGKSSLLDGDDIKLKSAINIGHGLNKKVRFWNAPDTPEAWFYLASAGVDYINTDQVVKSAQFLKDQPIKVFRPRSNRK